MMCYTEKVESAFGLLAFHIASHPWKVCIAIFFLNGFLGLGMLNLPKRDLLNNDIEEVYMPRDPPTLTTEQEILKIFPDYSGTVFYSHQRVRQPMYAEMIIWRKDKQSLINATLYEYLSLLMTEIKNISFISGHRSASYLDICARRNDKCVINGEEFIEQLPDCREGVLPLKKITSNDSTILENPLFQLADYLLVNETLMSATYLRIRFNLRQDKSEYRQDAKLWADHFISHLKQSTHQWYLKGICLAFAHPMSYLEELGNDTYRDIPYFSFVFTIYFIYLGFVMSGGNTLTKRSNIGRMGIIVTATSVLGAWGLLMACEVEFTNAIGIAPMFIVNHQVVNTMITLSYLSDLNAETDARKRVQYAMKKSAIPITATMLCHVVPFTAAIFTKYYAIQLVGIYIVTTTLFNYVNHFVFFTSCLAINELRINAGRHCCICTILRPREEVEGRNCCIICCCSGSKADGRTDTESSLETWSRKASLRFLLTTLVRCISLVSFLALIAFAIWGVINFRVDAIQENEVLSKSYFYTYSQKIHSEFENQPVIQFVIVHPHGFLVEHDVISQFEHSIQSRSFLQSNFLLNWKTVYDNTTFVNYTTEQALYDSVKHKFFSRQVIFQNDIHFSDNSSELVATRFYIKSKNIKSTKAMISMKTKLLDLTEDINEHFVNKYGRIDNNLGHLKTNRRFVFVHSPDFFNTDDWLYPLWEFLRFAGTQMALLMILFLLIKPTLLSLIHIPLTYASMMVSVFGISHFLGIYLTQVSMIVYMMAGSFFVEVIVHSFYSYIQASGIDSSSRVNIVLSTTTQSLFHAIFGQFLGLLVLFVVSSYVFVTVFKISLLTTGICVLFSLFWIPTFLSVLGFAGEDTRSETLDKYVKDRPSTSFMMNSNETFKGLENPAFE